MNNCTAPHWPPRGLRFGRDEPTRAAAAGFEALREGTGGPQLKVFVAGGTGAIGRPLIAALLAKGHTPVALPRSQEKARVLVEQGREPAIADVFDKDAVKAVVSRAQPEVVIEQLTALPRAYTRQSMDAGAALNNRIRWEGGTNVLIAAQGARGVPTRRGPDRAGINSAGRYRNETDPASPELKPTTGRRLVPQRLKTLLP